MKLSLLALPAAALVSLLGQVADLPVPELGNLTATAILGWFAWHTAARTIPELVRSFRAELAAIRAESQSDREVFRGELAEERSLRHADNLALTEALRQLAARAPPQDE